MDGERAWALGEIVRRERKRRNWSQRELAERSGVTGALIAKIEVGGVCRPGYDTIRMLSVVFEMKPDALMEEAERLALQRKRLDEMVPIYPSTLTDVERSQFQEFLERVRERISREGKARGPNSILSYPNDNSPSRFGSSVAGASPHLV